MGINLITGDTHGIPMDTRKLSAKNFKLGKTLTKEDTLIIAGDFGWLWKNDDEEVWWLNWLSERPWTTLVVDGNHENFDMFDALSTEERYGSDVGVIRPDVYHLRRGRVYTINDDRVFIFGGGLSVDKAHRIAYEEKKGKKAWWAREYPSPEELDLAWKNIMKHESVDYVVSHVPPEHILDYYLNISHHGKTDHDLVSLYLRDMSQVLRFKLWYHGHMHVDQQLHPKFIGLYHKIIRLGEELNSYGYENS